MTFNDHKSVNRGTVPIVLVFSLYISSLCDLLAYHNFGGFTGTAISSALYAIFLIYLIPIVILAKPKKEMLVALPFALFFLWNLFLLIIQDSNKAAFQTVTLYLVFFLNLIVFITFGYTISKQTLNRLFLIPILSISFLYLTVILSSGIGMSGLLGRRSFALEAVIFLSWFAFQNSKNFLQTFFSVYLLAILIFLSLSRTAIALTIIILIMRFFYRNKNSSFFSFSNFLGIIFFSFVAFYVLIQKVTVFRERVIGGDRAFNFGGFQFSSQGRNRIWSVVLENAADSKWIGHGPGSVRTLIATRIPGQTEPHNELLRVYFESGIIGLCLYASSFLVIFIFLYRFKTNFESLRVSVASVSACFLILSLTDNPAVYIFVIVPFSTILGIYFSKKHEV